MTRTRRLIRQALATAATCALLVPIVSCGQQEVSSGQAPPASATGQADGQQSGSTAPSMPENGGNEGAAGSDPTSGPSAAAGPSSGGGAGPSSGAGAGPSPGGGGSAASGETQLNASDAEQKFIDATRQDGVYEGAVLEAGFEACDKLAFLDSVDSEKLVGAIASGEVVNAEASVEFLCPTFEEAEAQASGGFGDGTFDVGDGSEDAAQVAPGSYTSLDPTSTCQWSLVDESGNVTEDGGAGSLEIPRSARQVISSGCYAWVPSG